MAHVARGDDYAAKKDYAAAIIEYRNAVALDTQFGDARLKLAKAYQSVGDHQNAYREAIRAADMLPNNAEAQLIAGILRLSSGEYAEARERAQAVLNKDPKNVRALILLGNALAGLKDFDGAVTQVEQALDTEPRVTLGYANLGMFELARGDKSAAENAFKKAVSVDPKSVAAQLNLGNFYWSGGRLPDAEAAFKQAFELDPKSPAAARALATFYIVNKRRAEAEPYLKEYSKTDTQAKIVLADYYLDSGKVAEATAVLKPLTSDKEGAIPASLRLAAIDFQQKRRPQAYATLEDVLKREPTNERAQEMKARFLVAEARYDEALKLADSLLKSNTNNTVMLYIRGTVFELQRKPELALSAFRDLLQQAPSSLFVELKVADLYLRQEQPNAALEVLGPAIKANPQSGYAHFLRGQALLRVGDIAGAEREITAVAKAVPDSADVHTWVGLVYQAKGDQRKARAAFERAKALAPDAPNVFAGLLSADMAEGKLDAARARIQDMTTRHAQDAQVALVSANALLAMHDLQKGERELSRVIELDPDNLEAFSKLAVLYHSQGRLTEAKAKYEELAKRSPRPVAAMTFLGLIAELEKNPQQARERYQHALELDPQAGIAANNLAWIYAQSGENLDVALQLAQTAKSQLPNAASVNDTLGWVYLKKGLATQAVGFLEEAAKGSQSNAGTQYRLGLAYLKTGDKGNARSAFERALKLNPQFENAEDARRELASLKG
jgi:tetratricopeptide (TPR) repeat protein